MAFLKENILFYSSSIGYLLDECKRMELLLSLFIKEEKPLSQGNSGAFYVSEEEIETLISPRNEKNEKSTRELEELRKRLDGLTAEISRKRDATLSENIFLSLDTLLSIFRLSPFEKEILLLALLPELDKKYERFYGFLQDDMTLRGPTVGLAADLLSWNSALSREEIYRYLLQGNNLVRFGILELKRIGDDARGIASLVLKLDRRITGFLFEVGDPDPLLVPFTSLRIPGATLPESALPGEKKERVLNLILDFLERKTSASNLLINLSGADENDKRSLAESVCAEAGLALLTVDVTAMIKNEIAFEHLVKKIFREGVLQPAAIYFENIDGLWAGEEEKTRTYSAALFRAAEEFSWIAFFDGEFFQLLKQNGLDGSLTVNVELPATDPSLRKRIWKALLQKEELQLEESQLTALASKFRLNRQQIEKAFSSARNAARFRLASDLNLEALYEGCRLQSSHKLSTLASRMRSPYSWEDIILPKERLDKLKEISNYIRYREQVYEEWGFRNKLSLGRGLNILFSGPSGTGKTMAAGVIANDLGLELYKIDLSSVISKYIGETEKNLARIFKEAENSNAILFFDEADALFGKRSEVKDSHDRYANIETGYLLQKLEEHDGIVIMASNLSKNIDDAFQRRMQFILEFPFPDEAMREKIWRNIFPAGAPLVQGIDFFSLADRFKLAGGNIKNIALHAAFLAAANSGTITNRHILQAVRWEYQKMGSFWPHDDSENEPTESLAG